MCNIKTYISLLIILFSIPKIGYSSENELIVDAFGQEIILPSYCRLIARPSVLSSMVKYTCDNEDYSRSGSIYFQKREKTPIDKDFNELTFIKNIEERKEIKLNDIDWVEITYRDRRDRIAFMIFFCDLEICMNVITYDKSFVSDATKSLHKTHNKKLHNEAQ